jgi:hypothetical protein
MTGAVHDSGCEGMGDAAGGDLTIIGWRERIHLPDWRLSGVRAKIDTGARTSAIDVARIEDLPDGRIRFEVVSRVKPTRKTRWIEAPVSRMSTVKPSSGEAQQRHVCVTRMRIGKVEHEIEVSLVCRANMLCRMLIGRTALAGRFAVDPSRKYVLSGPVEGSR